MTKLVLEWIRDQGGPEVIFERNRIKATMIYNLIDSSSGFYSSDVDPSCRSQMNIPFRIGRDGGSDALEAEFLKQAEGRQMLSLKGHRFRQFQQLIRSHYQFTTTKILVI